MNIEPYIGLRFLDGGRDRSGVDCWGLVRLVYQEQLGIQLPDFDIRSHDSQAIAQQASQEIPRWSKLDQPEPGAVVAIRLDQARHPGIVTHVGLCVDGGYFLHALERTGAVLTRVSHPYWRGLIEGFYRWPCFA